MSIFETEKVDGVGLPGSPLALSYQARLAIKGVGPELETDTLTEPRTRMALNMLADIDAGLIPEPEHLRALHNEADA